jgi:hypothetical protein
MMATRRCSNCATSSRSGSGARLKTSASSVSKLRSACSACSACTWSPMRTWNSTSGCARRKSATSCGMNLGASAWLATSLTLPRRRPCSSSISERTSSSALERPRTYCTKSSPAAVSRMPRGRRSKSGTPSSASRSLMRRLTAEGATCSRSAAWRMEPARAVSSKYFRKRRWFMPGLHAGRVPTALPKRQRRARNSAWIRTTPWHGGCMRPAP